MAFHTAQGSNGSGIADSFKALATHAEELLQATKSATGEGVELARQHLKDSLKQAEKRASDVESYMLERGKAALDATTGMVRERPWQAMAAATLLGAAIGCLAGVLYKGGDHRG